MLVQYQNIGTNGYIFQENDQTKKIGFDFISKLSKASLLHQEYKKVWCSLKLFPKNIFIDRKERGHESNTIRPFISFDTYFIK